MKKYSIFLFPFLFSHIASEKQNFLTPQEKTDWRCYYSKFEFDGEKRCHVRGRDKMCECVETNVGNASGDGLQI